MENLERSEKTSVMKISFFGPFTLSVGQRTLCESDSKAAKQWRLIKYLVLSRDRFVSRRELIDATFGYGAYSDRPAAALNALNAVFHRARKTLRDTFGDPFADSFCYKDSAYAFRPSFDVEIDSEHFEKLLSKIFSSGDLSIVKSCSLEALDLYKGSFLNKSFFGIKERALAEKYHEEHKKIFTLLCSLLNAEGDFDTLERISDAAIKKDPFCEQFRYEKVLSLIKKGEKELAASVYAETVTLFSEALSLTPSESFTELGTFFDNECGAGRLLVLLPKNLSGKKEAVCKSLRDALGEDSPEIAVFTV